MDQILVLLFYTFIGVTFINVTFYIFYMLFAFAKVKPQHSSHNSPPVSVIVCSKNEAENLKKNIPKILSQDYPLFEVILINDASYDNTGDVIEEFALNNKNVAQVQVENNEAFWGNKKYALTLGIKKANYPNLVFTDADCFPASNQWLKYMSSQFIDKKELVLGYGAYEKIKGSWLNKLIRFETLITAIQYFTWAKARKAYMGVGRNLAYTSSLFYEHNGFIKHMKIHSGDDDLFVNEVATRHNVAIQYDPESFTYSEPKKTLKEWCVQKRRHISTASYYKNIHKVFLSAFYSSQLLFFILQVTVLISNFLWQYALLIIGVRYLFTWVVVGVSSSKLKEKDLIILYPLREIALVLIQLGIFISNQLVKPTKWK